MAKYDPNNLSKKHRDALLNELSAILFKLESPKEIYNFLKDLLTESEEVMIARRLQIAKMLLNDCTYEDIKSKLKVGYDNIKNVKYFLDFGWGGYLKAVNSKKKLKP
ncbi:trp operon repressor [Patescibacteria group bacterium]|nr:trp operon repressor [Patescibacteria group bacterium]MBU4512156.1 trp operon repressor [Patescibacteria group bacterium]MCG2693040.1 YerC/YecD family TrpR-related protein [Candidatus Parcubacteria bacterium]